jgi:hypothetical protein
MVLYVEKANVKQGISQFGEQFWATLVVKRNAKIEDWDGHVAG